MSSSLNILYLHSHDTGRYIAPYGYAVPTPHLQRFADDAVLFRNAFCANPTCSPSRASLLTGMYTHSCGMMGLAHRGFAMPDYSKHLAHFLQSRGYTTALSGMQHEVAIPRTAELGYQHVLRSPHASDSHVGAIAFLQSRPRQPFFLSCGFFETHRPFPEPACDEPLTDPRWIRTPAPIPDTPETRRDFAAFNTMARICDQKMNAVLDALKRTGFADNTLVILTTDHGIAFPGMKCSLTDHGIGVMLMLRCPAHHITGGTVIDALVSHVDLFPTLCELAQLDKPDWLQGTSMASLLTGQSDRIRDEVFAEVNWHAAFEPKRAVRTQRYKLIRRYHDYPNPVLPNCDGSPAKNTWLSHGWAQKQESCEELYDLIFDPTESHNLADDPASADTLQQMRTRLDAWMHRTDDPLMAGPLTPRSGYIVDLQSSNQAS